MSELAVERTTSILGIANPVRTRLAALQAVNLRALLKKIKMIKMEDGIVIQMSLPPCTLHHEVKLFRSK